MSYVTTTEYNKLKNENDNLKNQLKNFIPKEKIKKEIEMIDLCIELQKVVNEGQNDNNPEKYHFSKKILQELLEEK